jgi:hypothetical protein
MEYRECRTCAEYLPIDDFYYSINERTGKIRLSTPDCKVCAKDRERKERRAIKDAAGIGSEKVFNTPNKYKDIHQKRQTFGVMLAMGWKFNEENGIWYDDIKKTSDGKCIGVWAEKPKPIKVKLKFDENKPPKIKFTNKRTEGMLSEEVVNQILYDHYVNKMSLSDLAIKYNTHKSTVATYTKYLYHQEMAKRKTTNIIPENKTSVLRKKHFKKDKPKSIPTITLTNPNPMFTDELIAKIQNDYFMGDLKFYEVVEKYSGYDAKTAAYIIRKTLTKIKLIKDADKE